MRSVYLHRVASFLLLAGLSASALAQTPPEPYNPFRVNNETPSITPGASADTPSQDGHGRGCGTGTLSWTENGSLDIPGLHWAYLKYFCHNNVEIAVWTDFTPGLFGGNPVAQAQGRQIRNNDGVQYSDPEGNRIIGGFVEANIKLEFTFVVSNGNAVGNINGTEYDLANGALFLVASNGSTMEVRQLDLNLAGISAEEIQLMARERPEITGFFSTFHAGAP